VSRLFPGKLNQAEAEERKKLVMRYLDIVSKIPRGHARTVELGMLREEFPAPSLANDNDGNGSVRLDFPMVTPIAKPRELWFDHAIVQETSPSHAEAMLKY